MRFARLTVLWSGALLVCLVGGCRKGAATPKEALNNCFRSVVDGDKSLFLNSTTGLPHDVATSVFEVVSAAADFQKRFDSAYGKDALGKHSFGIRFPSAQDIEAAEIKQDGNIASVSSPAIGSQFPLRLRREGDRWYVDLSMLNPAGADTKMLVELCRVAARGINDTKESIGKDGHSPDAVMTELGRRVFVGVWVAMLVDSQFGHREKGQTAAPPVAKADPPARNVETLSMPVAPGTRPTAGMTARDKIAHAQQHFGAELLLMRKHPWSKVPGGDVQSAVRRVFGIHHAPADRRGSPYTGVDFQGLTTAQVKSLIGNPSSKSAVGEESVWTYSYKGTRLSTSITFRQDKAVRTSNGTS